MSNGTHDAVDAPAADDMPPAPVVDPSAFKTTRKSQLIKASYKPAFGRWSRR